MRNRTKVMFLMMLFWIVVEIVLLLSVFSQIAMLIVITGTVISGLTGMFLDLYNTKVSKWFDSTEFIRK